MKIVKYRKGSEKQYQEDFKYWSNCCGDLHHHGEYDIKENDLPEDLLRAYRELWGEEKGSLCYLVEYKGEHGIALINEFDETFANDINSTMDALFLHMEAKADELSVIPEFETAQFLLAEEMGCFGCHEFVVIMPCNTSKELFARVADILYDKMYQMEEA